MLPFGVTIPATVPQRSEIPEELMNYPVCVCVCMYIYIYIYIYICVCVCVCVCWICTRTYAHIQGDSGEKINILWGDSIGNCEKTRSHGYASNSAWLPTEGSLNLQTQSAVNSNKQREITVILVLISIHCLNNKSVAVRNKCSKISPSTSVHFATGVWRSRVVRLSWSSRLFMQAAAPKLRASG